MVVLNVVSAKEATGKTAVCAGLAKNLLNDGKKVGYRRASGGKDGADAAFMKQALGLADGSGGDVLLVEGAVEPGLAGEKKAGVIFVAAYPAAPDEYAAACRAFGESLLGVILNRVPQGRLEQAKEEAAASLGAAGLRLLGVLPEDRALAAVTVGELADSIEGKILNNEDKASELVESYMLGAMVVDSGLDYFGRKSRKAALIRQDRPDMQLAALETSTSCLVLTGSSQPPVYNVMERAASRGIPVVASERGAEDIIAGIEAALAAGRLGQEKKLARLAEIVRQNLDISAVL